MLQNPNIRPPMNKEQLVQLLKDNCGAKEVANRPVNSSSKTRTKRREFTWICDFTLWSSMSLVSLTGNSTLLSNRKKTTFMVILL